MDSRPRLVVSDLDNTLYDWVTYFAVAFYAMVEEVLRLVPVERDQLLDDFQAVHRKHHNSEHPCAILEVECLRRHFGDASDREFLKALEPALHAFRSARKRTLRLYEGVRETLAELNARGILIVGHTDAVAPNAYMRLEMLGVRPFLTRLYAFEGPINPHSFGNPRHDPPPPTFMRFVPHVDRKPNPTLLTAICHGEGIAPQDTWYVGDSLTRDMGMAKGAGVHAVWARYGTKFDPERWASLVRITHWTEEDVKRESKLKQAFADVSPDHVIERFDELLTLIPQ